MLKQQPLSKSLPNALRTLKVTTHFGSLEFYLKLQDLVLFVFSNMNQVTHLETSTK
jgi:hypothetical protein